MAIAKKKTDKKAGKQGIQKAQSQHSLNPFEEMNRLFESYFPAGRLRPFHMEWPSWGELAAPFEGKTPRVDVIDRKKDILVKAALPGVDKKDIDISVTKNSVTIKGSTSHEHKEKKEDYYHSEISRGSYSRTLVLPAEVNESKAKAKFRDGILELTLPKTTVEKKKTRSVKVD
ncbi:MAG: Hsp20/alpha crystallin family protein [Desulfobacteraceae bacterium]|nr:Hsp20/alpha crystallin family protein [Desulfobacteraceae bacterium]